MTTATTDGWFKTDELLPCEKGEQKDVIFCSPGWACAFVGMFTNFGTTQEWAVYDQQSDCFYEYDSIPVYWMFMPKPPIIG